MRKLLQARWLWFQLMGISSKLFTFHAESRFRLYPICNSPFLSCMLRSEPVLETVASRGNAKMKKYVLVAAFGLALSGTANAAGMIDYAELVGGATMSPALDAPGGTGFNMDTGYNVGGTLGWWVGPSFSIEADFFYTNSNFSGFDVSLQTFSTMANALYHLDVGPDYRPFFGVGIGGVQVTHDDEFAATSDAAWVFGWQGIAGIAVSVDSKIDFIAEYRYQDAADATIVNPVHPAPGGVQEYQSHNISVGLRFNL